MIIYLTTNNINGMIYIGQTVTTNQYYLGSGRRIINAVKKYGRENFTRRTLQTCKTQEHLNQAEIYWIKKFDSQDRSIGYNIANGGNSDATCAESTKQLLREMNLGKTISEEQKVLISNTLKGRKLSKEHVENMKGSQKGYKHIIKEGKVKRVPPELVNRYLSEGWKFSYKERKAPKNGLKTINKLGIYKRVPQNELLFYLADGWEIGKTVKVDCDCGKPSVRVGYCKACYEKKRRLDKKEEQLALGISFVNGNLGKRLINKDGNNLRVLKEEIDKYLLDGWHLGGIKKGTKETKPEDIINIGGKQYYSMQAVMDILSVKSCRTIHKLLADGSLTAFKYLRSWRFEVNQFNEFGKIYVR
jgi:group I intron endonuclease